MPTDIQTRSGLLTAFWLSFVWVNLSEVARYFWVVRPMLHAAFPGEAQIAPMNLGVFALWGVWDLILIAAGTGFYWLWVERFSDSFRQILLASLCFSVTVFGLIWLGIANMGLVPYSMMGVAIPLAWLEQAIAAGIVVWARRRAQL